MAFIFPISYSDLYRRLWEKLKFLQSSIGTVIPMFANLKKLSGSETSNSIGKVSTTTNNNTMVNLVLLAGSALMLGAMYIYTDRKYEALRKENQARMDAKDARFEAFVERVLAATRQLSTET